MDSTHTNPSNKDAGRKRKAADSLSNPHHKRSGATAHATANLSETFDYSQLSHNTSIFTTDALTPDALTTDALAPDTLAPDTLAPDALTTDALTPDALAPDALTTDALALDAPATSSLSASHLDTSPPDTDFYNIDNFDIKAVDVDNLHPVNINTAPFESYARQIDYDDSEYAAAVHALNTWALDTGYFNNGAFTVSSPLNSNAHETDHLGSSPFETDHLVAYALVEYALRTYVPDANAHEKDDPDVIGYALTQYARDLEAFERSVLDSLIIDTTTLDLTGNANLDHLNNVNDNATLDGLYYTPDEEQDLPITQPAPQQPTISQNISDEGFKKSSTSGKRRSVAARRRTTAVVNSLAPSSQKALSLATDPPSLQEPSLASSNKKSKPGPDVGPWNILTDDMASAMSNGHYDPYWLGHCGRDIESFSLNRALKLDLLFRNDVLRINDVFVISVNDRSSGTVVDKRMEVVALSGSAPDMSIPYGDPAQPPSTLQSVRSIGILVAQLVANDPSLSLTDESSRNLWNSVIVERDGARIDNLTNIRKAFHIYQLEIDRWALRTDRPRRHRHVPRDSGAKWENNRFVKLIPDGTWRPLRDQIQAQMGLTGSGKAARFNKEV